MFLWSETGHQKVWGGEDEEGSMGWGRTWYSPESSIHVCVVSHVCSREKQRAFVNRSPITRTDPHHTKWEFACLRNSFSVVSRTFSGVLIYQPTKVSGPRDSHRLFPCISQPHPYRGTGTPEERDTPPRTTLLLVSPRWWVLITSWLLITRWLL